MAEKLKGAPPDNSWGLCSEQSKFLFTSHQYGWAFVLKLDLYREDVFCADRKFYLSSCNLDGPSNKSGFEKFSERFRHMHPGYCLDKEITICPRVATPVLNMENLLALLKSKDKQMYRDNSWMFQNEFKFLDQTPISWNKIAFVSFPGIGNTFLRKVCDCLQEWSLALTCRSSPPWNSNGGPQGWDGHWWPRMDRQVSLAIHLDNTRPFRANKVFAVVRNPLDVFLSWFGVLSLDNHNFKLEFDPSTEFP